MPTASLAADTRLSLSSHPRPVNSSPAVRSPSVKIFFSSFHAFNSLRHCAISHDGKPKDRLRRPWKCSSSENSSGATTSAVDLQKSLELKARAAELVNTLKGTSIFLVGMNGLMKTKSGMVLAEALQYCYFDSDEVFKQVAGGAEAARDFRDRDEKGFLESESEVLRQLSSMARLVVCVGDSATQGTTNLSYLRYGISIWIDIPLDIMAGEKFANSDDTSDAFDKSAAELARCHAKMKGGYATADATISLPKVAAKLGYGDLGDLTPEDVAFEVIREIDKLTRVKKMMEDAARPF